MHDIITHSDAIYDFFLYRSDGKAGDNKVTLPVYLNATRQQLLFTLDFDTEGVGSGKDHSFYERGVALVCSDLS